MRVERELTVGERTITVRELTVGEIRQWLKEIEGSAQTVDVVGSALFEEITFADLGRFTTLASRDLDGLAPSEIRAVIEVVKEINADFFLLRGRLVALGQEITRRLAPSDAA